MFDVANAEDYEEYLYRQQPSGHGEYVCPRCGETWRVESMHSARDVLGIMAAMDSHREVCGKPMSVTAGGVTIG